MDSGAGHSESGEKRGGGERERERERKKEKGSEEGKKGALVVAPGARRPYLAGVARVVIFFPLSTRSRCCVIIPERRSKRWCLGRLSEVIKRRDSGVAFQGNVVIIGGGRRLDFSWII